jgi:5-(carboxyamino)imidazole ribonucleotide mutase
MRAKPIYVVIVYETVFDKEKMRKCAEVLAIFGIAFTYRMALNFTVPDDAEKTISDAEAAGCKVFICAGVNINPLMNLLTNRTIHPVIGVPLTQDFVDPTPPRDAPLPLNDSGPRMPRLLLGVNEVEEAAIFAIQILATSNVLLSFRLRRFQQKRLTDANARK